MDQSEEIVVNPPKKTITKVLLILVVIIFFIPIIIIGLIYEIYCRLSFRMRALYLKKRIIFVNSDSPIWHEYLNNKWLTKVMNYAYILNWSEIKKWKHNQWDVRMFRHWGGDRNMTPIMIIYMNFFQIRIFRFYEAFIDYKHGRTKNLIVMEAEIEKALATFIKG
jgi:hypothetical protein